MKVKIWVDWDRERILQKEDVVTEQKAYEDNIRSDQEVANDILEYEEFSFAEIFYMSDELREEMNKRIEDEIKRKAKVYFDDNYEEITLDV